MPAHRYFVSYAISTSTGPEFRARFIERGAAIEDNAALLALQRELAPPGRAAESVGILTLTLVRTTGQ